MADQPLSPATDRRLGGPLPRQLANQPRAHLCAIKSLVKKPCGSLTLCGISVRFQTLFPSQRQVAHVLLTRPPLKNAKQAQHFSVRLACVRRAASVRPEPGSNSLEMVYISPLGATYLFQKLNSLLVRPFGRFTLALRVPPGTCAGIPCGIPMSQKSHALL